MRGVSLSVALHLANKCKSKGEKPRNKDRDLLYQFFTNGGRNAETIGDGTGVLAFRGRYGETA